MNKRLIIIVSGGVLVLLIGVVAYFIIASRSNNSTKNTAVDTPLQIANFPGSAIKEQQGSDLVWQTEKGPVTIKNIFNQEFEKSELGDPVRIQLAKTDNYQITYERNGDYFNIVLLKTPYTTSRAIAETSFLSLLGISKTDACKLPSNVAPQTNSDYAMNYGFSFCPDSIKLP